MPMTVFPVATPMAPASPNPTAANSQSLRWFIRRTAGPYRRRLMGWPTQGMLPDSMRLASMNASTSCGRKRRPPPRP